jgi:mannose-6-phosphate isomerase-like protein (cupin superfamily)
MAGRKPGMATTVGKRIKQARIDQKLSPAMVANETGLAVDYIKAVESGKVTPSVGTLLQIARILKIDSGSLLKSEEPKVEERIKAYTKRTENYAYTTLTPGAEHKHLKAFRVLIEPQQEHQGVGYLHEGEEFIYVLTGRIEVMVGDHQNRLKKNESLHFNSGIKHQLRNIGKTRAELLVVIYGP